MPTATSDAFVFFGATGDLAYKQIFPALQASLLTIGGQLPVSEGGKQDFKISINDPPTGTLRWYIQATDDEGETSRIDTRALDRESAITAPGSRRPGASRRRTACWQTRRSGKARRAD